VIGFTVPAVAAEFVRGEVRSLLACCNHNTKSLTSAEVTLSHSTPTTCSHRHHRSKSCA
jgi:hypothetical protein